MQTYPGKVAGPGQKKKHLRTGFVRMLEHKNGSRDFVDTFHKEFLKLGGRDEFVAVRSWAGREDPFGLKKEMVEEVRCAPPVCTPDRLRVRARFTPLVAPHRQHEDMLIEELPKGNFLNLARAGGDFDSHAVCVSAECLLRALFPANLHIHVAACAAHGGAQAHRAVQTRRRRVLAQVPGCAVQERWRDARPRRARGRSHTQRISFIARAGTESARKQIEAQGQVGRATEAERKADNSSGGACSSPMLCTPYHLCAHLHPRRARGNRSEFVAGAG